MRVLVIANRVDPEPGHVGDALVARGAVLDPVWREDPDAWPDPADVGLVLSLGSDWSVYWDHVGPQVDREAAYLRAAVGAGVPVLGLCFGGQLLAHALGGRVEPAPRPEIGWFAVESDRPDVLPPGPYAQWHVDRFVPPDDAVELARSPVGSQAFALGSAVGLQFHPEATPEMLHRWVSQGAAELAARGVDGPAIVHEARSRAAEARDRAVVIVEAFLAGLLAP
ncbi:MAG: type 1 glutamine amidotransferase [Actinomycetia bacterium]|nr:type 1 glutamine amidotransferase [Actinomycetes bacterium]